MSETDYEKVKKNRAVKDGAFPAGPQMTVFDIWLHLFRKYCMIREIMIQIDLEEPMGNKNNTDFGRVLGDALQDALLSGDYSRLRKTVNDTVHTVVDKTIDCARSAEEAAERFFDGKKTPPGWGSSGWNPGHVWESPEREGPQEPPQNDAGPAAGGTEGHGKGRSFAKNAPPGAARRASGGPQTAVPQKQADAFPAPPYLKKTGRDKFFGGFTAAAGFFIALPAGMTALAMAIHEAPYGFRILPVAASSILIAVAVLCMIMAVNGLHMFGRAKRFRQYWSLLREKGFCDLSSLAEAVEKRPKYVFRDISRMMNAGLLPGGHFDKEKTCLIMGEDLYRQYLLTQEGIKRREKMTADPVIAAGLEAVHQIRAANAALPGAVITEKLNRLEDVTAGIFAYVEQRPAKLQEIRRFMDYYLPTTVKMVKSYQEFEAQAETAAIRNAKDEILATLDTISTAFETLLDGLYQDDTLDISTDISVLKTMLAQEGLTGRDFEKRDIDHE